MEQLVTIDIRKAVVALSDALDLVGIDEIQHGKRVAYIAVECGKRLGLDVESCNELFEIGLIHDIGVSETSVHKHLLESFEWEDENIHCQVGFELIKDYQPLADYAFPILYHHTPWKKLKDIKLSSRHKRFANIIHLADKVNTFATPYYGEDLLKKIDAISTKIAAEKDRHFNASITTAFLDIATRPAFWIALDSRYLVNFINERSRLENEKQVSLKEVRFLAKIFASIVDAKSKFTAEHSFNVAALSLFIAETYGLSQSVCMKIEIAGLLHDIGKLRIPDDILNKNGTLTDSERAIINQHSFETYEILRKIPGLEDIALWAGFHHETLNQKGYPFHPSAERISIEARIISIADIFQALAQERPYRQSLSTQDIASILHEKVEQGELDEMIVDIVDENLEQCYEIAIMAPQETKLNF
mgnify:FL=1